MKQAERYLRSAHSLLKLKGWCQGAMALDKAGNDVDDDYKRADKFCAMGAVAAATDHLNRNGVFRAKIENRIYDALQAAIPVGSRRDSFEPSDAIVHYNDDVILSRSQALAWFRRAIRKASK